VAHDSPPCRPAAAAACRFLDGSSEKLEVSATPGTQKAHFRGGARNALTRTTQILRVPRRWITL
jgi:hypothetical protein